jgi:hypothetical protein
VHPVRLRTKTKNSFEKFIWPRFLARNLNTRSPRCWRRLLPSRGSLPAGSTTFCTRVYTFGIAHRTTVRCCLLSVYFPHIEDSAVALGCQPFDVLRRFPFHRTKASLPAGRGCFFESLQPLIGVGMIAMEDDDGATIIKFAKFALPRIYDLLRTGG